MPAQMLPHRVFSAFPSIGDVHFRNPNRITSIRHPFSQVLLSVAPASLPRRRALLHRIFRQKNKPFFRWKTVCCTTRGSVNSGNRHILDWSFGPKSAGFYLVAAAENPIFFADAAGFPGGFSHFEVHGVVFLALTITLPQQESLVGTCPDPVLLEGPGFLQTVWLSVMPNFWAPLVPDA